VSAAALWPLQQAVYDRLTADAGLTALLAEGAAGVFDHVPQASAFPYVTIGEASAAPGELASKTEAALAQSLTLHVWSRDRGFGETKRILAALAAALDDASGGAPLTVAGQTLVALRFEFAATFLDPDGLTRHGVQRFRAWTQPA